MRGRPVDWHVARHQTPSPQKSDAGHAAGKPRQPTRAVHRAAGVWTSGREPVHGARLKAVTEPRFLRLSDVAEVLNISAAQTYALVRSGELPAMKIGGRGQWRVERDQLEDYISRMYKETSEFLAKHPFVDAEDASD